jgi:hypothetical protein
MGDDNVSWRERERAEDARQAVEAAKRFPYELVTTTGVEAYDVWRGLKTTRSKTPIILGGDGDLHRLDDAWGRDAPDREGVATALAVRTIERARSIDWPDTIFSFRRDELEAARRRAAPRTRPAEVVTPAPPPAWMLGMPELLKGWVGDVSLDALEPPERLSWEAPFGDWPIEPFMERELTVAQRYIFDDGPTRAEPLDRVYIALLPTHNAHEAPAWLNWGNWNAVPPSEVLVAALTSWQERFGAELIGMSHDTWNLKVARRPQNREAAYALAQEMIALCEDLLGGVEHVSGQAALVMANEWWTFWWD